MAKRSTTARDGSGLISGIRKLAAAIGRSHQAASNWVNHAEWPYGRGPWPRSMVPEMQAWAARTLAPDPASPDGAEQLATERKHKLTFKEMGMVARIRRDNVWTEKQLENLHRIDECRLRRVRQLKYFSSRLFGELDGLAMPPECIDVVRTWLAGIFEDISRGDANRQEKDVT